MLDRSGPNLTRLDQTGPDRIESERTVPRYNRIPVNVLCAHAKHKTLTSYWSTKMDNVKLELLITNNNEGI